VSWHFATPYGLLLRSQLRAKTKENKRGTKPQPMAGSESQTNLAFSCISSLLAGALCLLTRGYRGLVTKMRALLLGRVLRRERYNVLVSYENSVYLGLVKKKVWEQDKVLVNDRVWFEPITDTEVSVERTAGRKNYFLRPPVANLDLLVYVHSFKNPQCDVRYLDLTLGLATLQNIPVLVLFHKADLLSDEDIQPWTSLYTSLGYNVMVTSVYYDLSALKERLRGKTVLFSGPTGVGKSSLVKALWKDASVRVGDISKVGRGKHTTSWVELLPLDDTYVVVAGSLETCRWISKDSLQAFSKEKPGASTT